jgi:rubredoxin
MANLERPNIATMSDDALDDAFRHLDGAWSRQTRGLVAHFGATGLDLNDNWAGVGRYWMCPSCQRTKSQIARVSERSILLCHLEWHHDHLRDYGKHVLRTRNPLPESDVERRSLMTALDATKDFCERFFRTLVCKDCNLAEGEAKRSLPEEAPRDFSFSPAEIRRFIVPRHNGLHVIDHATALGVWREVQADVEDRVAFVEVLAERVAHGRHRRQGSPPNFWAGRSTVEIATALASPGFDGGQFYAAPRELAERSIRRDGQGSAGGKPRRKKAIARPTDADMVAFLAAQHPDSPWLTVEADWRCACCERDRRAVLRKSNAGKWTGKLQAYAVFEPETDWSALMFHDVWDGETLVFREHSRVWLCGDCRHVVTDLKAAGIAKTDYPFSLTDLRSLLRGVEANDRPDIDSDGAVELARERGIFQAAVDRYFAHHGRCLNLAIRFRQLVKHLRWAPVDAFNRLFCDVLDSQPEAPVSDERLRWQLEEGARFLLARGDDQEFPNDALREVFSGGAS